MVVLYVLVLLCVVFGYYAITGEPTVTFGLLLIGGTGLTATSQYRGHRYEVEQTMRQHPGSQTPGQLCRITEDDANKEQSEHDRDIPGCRFRFTGVCKTEKGRL